MLLSEVCHHHMHALHKPDLSEIIFVHAEIVPPSYCTPSVECPIERELAFVRGYGLAQGWGKGRREGDADPTHWCSFVIVATSIAKASTSFALSRAYCTTFTATSLPWKTPRTTVPNEPRPSTAPP